MAVSGLSPNIGQLFQKNSRHSSRNQTFSLLLLPDTILSFKMKAKFPADLSIHDFHIHYQYKFFRPLNIFDTSGILNSGY
jgi:hypothetical protein